MDKLSHAYIISSESQTAGMDRAIGLSQRILCSSTRKKPCGVCRDCRKVASGIHPDVSIIRRLPDESGKMRSEIVINQIRDMRRDAAVLPNEADGKIYVIEEAEKMNTAAQNAALKLFEEPPENVHFILLTNNPEKLLPTVRSRCVMQRCASDEAAFDEQTETLAGSYVDLVQKGNAAELCEWCFENEKLEQRKLPDFLYCVKRKLIELCRYSDGKKRIMDNIALIDRCLEYQKVNTSVKHIFGLLAVRSLPTKETRKKVD